MKEKNKENEKNKNIGEFIPSYFGWISLDEQKKRTEELDKKTNK